MTYREIYRYRNICHARPCLGKQLPAFVVAQYDKNDFLLYSHGAFDIWCVYHAVSLDNIAAQTILPDDYPLSLQTIEVEKMTGTNTDFIGSFVEYAVVNFEFDAPEDVDYMQEIRDLAVKYGRERVWSSFLDLYEVIPQKRDVEISREMTQKVLQITAEYPGEPRLRYILDCLLCAMIAENNRLCKYGSKFDTKLGKKVKALGIYQAIFEPELGIREVANYSKGQSVEWISNECANRGINTPNM
ncbi:hypothetical protein KPC83_06720 [Collinsella sp. zg1085]|uniref:DUF7004 family protein n=1 Tax=Collinsella sp. zg1085 TaxID=2844380 RepID=UPI001C0D37AC|nr:hypothetical protein [Collinsella sp. zg1085]QWT17522.1 hypothetical protein KPC83_06720 [Collinsella sp. zg1085]